MTASHSLDGCCCVGDDSLQNKQTNKHSMVHNQIESTKKILKNPKRNRNLALYSVGIGCLRSIYICNAMILNFTNI